MYRHCDVCSLSHHLITKGGFNRERSENDQRFNNGGFHKDGEGFSKGPYMGNGTSGGRGGRGRGPRQAPAPAAAE